MTDRPRRLHGALVLALAVPLLAAACGSGRAPSSAASPTLASPTIGAPGPTAVPDPGETDPAGSAGGGSDGQEGSPGGGTNPGGGILDPGQIGGIFDPGGAAGPDGEPQLVGPDPNVRNARDVAATRLEAAVNGRRVAIRVSWWSGVEPCAALAGIDVAHAGMDITLTVREGSAAPPDTMCTQQLVYKAAVVDLGELEPGTWTVRAFGEAEPIEVVVED